MIAALTISTLYIVTVWFDLLLVEGMGTPHVLSKTYVVISPFSCLLSVLTVLLPRPTLKPEEKL